MASKITDEATKLYEKANASQNLQEKEVILVEAVEMILKGTRDADIKYEANHPNHPFFKSVYQLLETITDTLFNTPKQREKTGSAVYFLSGIHFKQGGSYKNWKERWFIVNDSSIQYYKDKKDWEVGPVKGNPPQPKGVIEFVDVYGIKACGTVICQDQNVKHDSRPKKGSHCIHIETWNRTFNIVGFTPEEEEKWISTLKFAIKMFNVKKSAKKWLKDNASLSSKPRSSTIVTKSNSTTTVVTQNPQSLDNRRVTSIDNRRPTNYEWENLNALVQEIAIPKANDLLKKLVAELNSQDILEDLFLEVAKFKAFGKWSNSKEFLALLLKDEAFAKYGIRTHLEKIARKMAILKAV